MAFSMTVVYRHGITIVNNKTSQYQYFVKTMYSSTVLVKLFLGLSDTIVLAIYCDILKYEDQYSYKIKCGGQEMIVTKSLL